MPDNLSFDVKVGTDGSNPVMLPSGETVANSQFSRDGADLYLRDLAGHAVKIEGYFSHNPPPDLVTADGARLPHGMVDAFLPPQHPGQYAANDAPANDASPVGRITQVVGDATITHPDGTHVKIDAGMPVHMGDVVETSAKGAVHILFSDNTTFAISESARLSIDNFTYNPDAHSGTSIFSMLHGVFVYTSGLIGKHDPGSVNIETPVGSIGIRGTVIAGNIHAAGQQSSITVVDGAIVVSNGGGTLEMSNGFDTATLSSYTTPPADSGAMTTQTFNTTYSAVAPADPSYYPLTGQHAPEAPHTAPTTPTTTMPDTMTHATPGNSVGTTVTVTGTTTPNIPDAHDPTIADPSVSLTNTTVTSPTSPTSFTSDTSTFGSTTSTGSSFSDAPVTTGGVTSSGLGSTGSTLGATGSTGLTGSTGGGGGSGSGTGTGSGGSPATANFVFSSIYTNNTVTTVDDGIPLMGTFLSSLFSSQNWMTTTLIGQIETTGLTAPTFALSGPGLVSAGGGVYNLIGDTLTPTTGGGSTVASGVTIAHLIVDTSGNVSMTFDDLSGFAYIPNVQTAGFNFTATATDSGGHTATTQLDLQSQPTPPTGALNILIGGEAGSATIDTFSAITGNNLIDGRDGIEHVVVGSAGSENIVIGGNIGADSLIWTGAGEVKLYGGGGNGDTFVLNAPGSFFTDNFSLVNGGSGSGEILQLGATNSSGLDFNFEGTNKVSNIEVLSIAAQGSLSTTPVATVELNMQNIFDMNSAHTLAILNTNSGYLTSVTVDTSVGSVSELQAPPTITNVGAIETITGVLASNGQTVTLVINQGAQTANDGVAVTVH